MVNTDNMVYAASGFGYLPITRQIGIFLGLAVSIAIGVAVTLWAQEPNYRPLFSQLNPKDSAAVTDKLQALGIPYKVDAIGSVMVPGDKVYNARMQLAAEGLPRGDGQGYELLEKSGGIGTSQFMERARYVQAMEGELARTIASFHSVKSARVHVALPRQSVFVRDKRKPSASVFLDLYSGRMLSNAQVDSIVSLVASSIPDMEDTDVTVVDQKGNLLTDSNKDQLMGVADKQLKFTNSLESAYVKKIEDLLTPILGPGKVKARVAADVDFTDSKQTKESYNPDFPALRSEQMMSEKRSDASAAAGIPGALSNQPKEEESDGAAPKAEQSNERQQSTKNYELDKTVSYTRKQVGQITRLSVAVLLDDKTTVAEGGKVERTKLSPEELQEITRLVREAIGFNPQRGDSVSVINKSFATPAPVEAMPETPIYQQAWFWDVVKQSLGGLFVLFMIVGVIRPIFKSLTQKGVEVKDLVSKHIEMLDKVSEKDGAAAAAEQLMSYDEQMRTVKGMANEDPKRVAQVVKRWMDSE